MRGKHECPAAGIQKVRPVFLQAGRRRKAVLEIESLLGVFVPFHVARFWARSQKRLEVHLARGRRRPELAGEGDQHFLQAARNVAGLVEGAVGSALGRDEDKLLDHGREFGMRIECVPNRAAVVPSQMQRVEQRGLLSFVRLGGSGLPLHAHHAELAAGRRFGQPRSLRHAEARVENPGQRIVEQQRGVTLFHVIDKVRHLRLRERRRHHDHQHVVFALIDRAVGRDVLHDVLLLEFGDDLPFALSADHVRVGPHHADREPLLVGDGANRSRQLVFQRRRRS